MTIDLLIALIGYAFVSSVTPGPNNLMLLASGMNFGFVRTLPHMLGISMGFGAMFVVIAAGLGQIFEAVPQLFTVLKVLAVLYLTYLAWKIATAAPLSDRATGSEQDGKPFSFLQAAAFQWVNPKAVAMAITTLTVYTPQQPSWGVIGLVAFVFSAINLPSVGVWTVIGQQVRRLLANPSAHRVFNIGCAVLLLASLYPILT
ncbi:MAG: LysE family translocator [Pseudomonadota bacterium]